MAGQATWVRVATVPSGSTTTALVTVGRPTVGTLRGSGSRVLGAGSLTGKLVPKAKMLLSISLNVICTPPPRVNARSMTSNNLPDQPRSAMVMVTTSNNCSG